MSDMFIDLSHSIEDGLTTYKGLPAPVVCDYLARKDAMEFYDDGAEFQIGKIEMVTNTGTYIDSPFHRFQDGKDLSEISLHSFADIDGVVIRVPYDNTIEIDSSFFEGVDLSGKAVLIHTDWSDFWNTESYFENHPFLTAEAANMLKREGVKLVGIDSHNIDDTRGRTRPVHATLLGNEILIVEHLCNLRALPEKGFKFSAVPPKFRGVGTFPVRAMAKIYTTI